MDGKVLSANQLTSEIIEFLYREGVFCWRQNTGGVYDKRLGLYRTGAKRGVADILGCMPPEGKFIAIEVKIGKDRLSPEQSGFLKNIEHYGGLSFVVGTLDDFKEQWLSTT